MKRKAYYIFIGFSSIIVLGITCTGETEPHQIAERPIEILPNYTGQQTIKTALLKKEDFPVELSANGRLTASRKADLKFKSDGIITLITAREGLRVQIGDVLAELDTTQLIISKARSALGLRKAWLDYEDHLLRLGYQLSDTAKLPTATKNIARLRSGLSTAEIEEWQRTTELENMRLTAPFSGKIANLKAREHNTASAFEYVCTLVDDSELTVDFQVLEQELPFIQASNTVAVFPFSGSEKRYTGTIASINPLIDDAGMVGVKARIKNDDGKLLDGMNVRILAQQVIANQLIVPKEAVLDRQGRKVVFTRQDTLSKWNYVDIVYENSSSYAISSETLKPGDEVIVQGNFNLSHDKPLTGL